MKYAILIPIMAALIGLSGCVYKSESTGEGGIHSSTQWAVLNCIDREPRDK